MLEIFSIGHFPGCLIQQFCCLLVSFFLTQLLRPLMMHMHIIQCKSLVMRIINKPLPEQGRGLEKIAGIAQFDGPIVDRGQKIAPGGAV